MQIIWDDLHAMSSPFLWEKWEKYFEKLFAVFVKCSMLKVDDLDLNLPVIVTYW